MKEYLSNIYYWNFWKLKQKWQFRLKMCFIIRFSVFKNMKYLICIHVVNTCLYAITRLHKFLPMLHIGLWAEQEDQQKRNTYRLYPQKACNLGGKAQSHEESRHKLKARMASKFWMNFLAWEEVFDNCCMSFRLKASPPLPHIELPLCLLNSSNPLFI